MVVNTKFICLFYWDQEKHLFVEVCHAQSGGSIAHMMHSIFKFNFLSISIFGTQFKFQSCLGFLMVTSRIAVISPTSDFANVTFANVFGRLANAMSRLANVLLVTSPTQNI